LIFDGASLAGRPVALASSGEVLELACGLLLAVLACAVIRPFGWPEAVTAVPAAVLVVGTGAISPGQALAETG
jgi:Na+/H+ antiporter NhaD/arsenite permease-like protein